MRGAEEAGLSRYKRIRLSAVRPAAQILVPIMDLVLGSRGVFANPDYAGCSLLERFTGKQ